MNSKLKKGAVILAVLLAIGFTFQYYWSNFWLYASIGAPPVAPRVPAADCTIDDVRAVDIKAEAAKIEALASVVTPNWQKVQTDPVVHAKAVELADTLHLLSRSNVVFCPGYGRPSFYSSLTFVAEQIRKDQGLGIMSGFPEIHMFGNRYSGEPDLIEFWYKKGVTIEVSWSRDFDEQDQLSAYVNQQETPPVMGTLKKP